MTGPLLGYILEGIVAVLAWGVAARRRYHRPIAWGLSVMAVADIARGVLAAAFFAGKSGPYVGGARLLFHLDEALYLAGPAALAWMAVEIFIGKGGAHVAGVVALTWVVLVLGYPVPFRGEGLALVYLGAHVVACLVLGMATLAWYLRWPGRWMSGSGSLLLLYAASDVVTSLGPYADDPFNGWASIWQSLFVVHLAAVLMQLAMLLARSPGARVEAGARRS